MISKQFNLIEKSDIDFLIENQVRENKRLDYKEILPTNSDADKKEFLADISSFANTLGGDIIYGIKENKDPGGNVKISYSVLTIASDDSEILRLEQIISNGISPRINGIQIDSIKGFTDGCIIIIRIPKTWNYPHMVTFKNSSRFFARNSAGKYQLDVNEIRSAFLISNSLEEKIRHFRDERIAKILADETPILLNKGARMALHFIPVSSFNLSASIDVVDLKNKDWIKPIGKDICSHQCRNNIDGFLKYDYLPPKKPDSYIQVFRNGVIESVYLFNKTENHSQSKYIPYTYEALVIEQIKQHLDFTKKIGMIPPFIILLTILDVKGYKLSYPIRNNYPGFSDTRFEIDRNILFLPDVIFEDYQNDVATVMRPVFDSVWQASGDSMSLNYDTNGKWIGQ